MTVAAELPAGAGASFDADEENTNQFDPLVPRAIDLPTELPADGDLATEAVDLAKIFAAPRDPADWPAWRARLVSWRAAARERQHYSGAAYDDPSMQWTSTCYSVGLVWLWDERLFDHAEQRFTPDEFLAGAAEFGGFDAVVLWHAYPVIGIDDRNQFDFYREVPGIRDLIARFQELGLHVFIDYNPWDVGTRRAENDDAAELRLLVGELGVDGVFLDTLKEGDAALTAALRSTVPPQALEGESRVPLARIEDHQLSWAQWFADSHAPGVLRAHWYERRHMMHHTRRWNRDHSDELQSSWMNGTGMLVWDAVFGVWVGWNARDRDTVRRMLAVQRAFSTVFIEGEWTPLCRVVADASSAGVFASRFELGDTTIWTIVNRAQEDYRGAVLAGTELAGTELADGLWFDTGSGVRLQDGRAAVLVPARGITGIIRVGSMTPRLRALLEATAGRQRSMDASFPVREAIRVVPDPSTGRPASDAVVLAPGVHTVEVRYRRRETGRYQGAPYVEEWKPLPPRLHDYRSESHTVELSRVAVAVREVTVAEFSRFRSATGVRPGTAGQDTGERPDAANDGQKLGSPATWIGLDEARAYASWQGARLPTEFEWQLAAADARFERNSPLVWEWTESEHSDGITRFVMLKGGSDHVPEGSDWYFDGGPREPGYSAKFLLMGLGLNRSPSIGFRLAWDLDES